MPFKYDPKGGGSKCARLASFYHSHKAGGFLPVKLLIEGAELILTRLETINMSMLVAALP